MHSGFVQRIYAPSGFGAGEVVAAAACGSMLGEVAVLKVRKVWKPVGRMVAVVVGVRMRGGEGEKQLRG